MVENLRNEIIAIDFGGTNLRAALVRNNKIIKEIKNKTPKTKNEILDKIYSLIQELMNKNIKGIGVASPGPLEKGVLKNPPNIPFKNFDLRRTIQNKFKVKTVVENDATCVALAESKLGIKKKNFIILTIGTGIGGGIIINKEFYKGEGEGGELGHLILDHGKDFETLASGKAIKKITKREFGKELLISDLLKRRDKKSKKIIDKEVEYLAQGIASLINVFDPEIIELNGGVRETGQVLLNKIRASLLKYQIIKREVPIRWTKLRHPGLIGASLLIN